MTDTFAISEVAWRTGLTLRALRFCEARGLVAPVRSASGRRFYGAGELERLNAVVALKRAGFSLSEIAGLLRAARIEAAKWHIDGQVASASCLSFDTDPRQARSLLRTNGIM